MHVLDLTERWAYCVNLPVEFGLGSPSANVIAVSPDGAHLFIADGHRRALAVLDTTALSRLALISRARRPWSSSRFRGTSPNGITSASMPP